MLTDISIHALLAESDSKLLLQQHRNRNFYPRSPCGERQAQDGYKDTVTEFLSTLSLRRATHIRSTSHGRRGISIHALLAESDFTAACIFLSMPKFLSTLSLRRATLVDTIAPDQKTRFLSTLSLRRATGHLFTQASGQGFLSTLSLRRATGFLCGAGSRQHISIHALLAESDLGCALKFQ